MTKKAQSLYTCTICDHQVNKWLGRCPECQTWNSFQEELVVIKSRAKFDLKDEERSEALGILSKESKARLKSGIEEFDRVVGGGLMQGAFVLCAGEPGVGKSTLLLHVLGAFARDLKTEKLLYVSGEESTAQIGGRANRLGVKNENIHLLNEVLWQTIERSLKKLKPKILVIDSIQTLFSNDVDSLPGSPTQMKEMAFQLLNYAKKNEVLCLVIGHITKDGSIAGPKLLEHIVDIVLTFEGEPKSENRILRCSKNRFGETHQVGLFEMNEHGLRGINQIIHHQRDRESDTVGNAYSLIKEGTRLLALEVQALVIENKFSNGRRVSQGIDHNHLSILIAIIEKYLGVNLSSDDIYLNLSGGIKPQGRESDLAIIAAILSSKLNRPVSTEFIFLGETSLTGSLKGITIQNHHLNEIKSWGFQKLISPKLKNNANLGSLEVMGLSAIKDITKLISTDKAS